MSFLFLTPLNGHTTDSEIMYG